MRTKVIVLLLASSLAVWAANKVQPLNVRVGLWEVSTTVSSNGQMPIPADLLARLTPEQRARMEERMKANSAGKTRTTTHKNCLTKEKLDRGDTFSEDRKTCTETLVTSTSSTVEVRVVCENEGVKSNGTFHIDALNPENIKGSIHMVAAGGNHSMNMSSTFTGKWIASSCGDLH
jgi:hypothetical protein